MISISSIIALILCGILIIAIPIILSVLILKKSKKASVALLAGVLSFLVMQVAIRIPLLQILGQQSWYTEISKIWLILFTAVTAALFETAGRILSIKYLIKKEFSFTQGLAHGVGHGGVEAILLVGLNFFIYGIMAIMFNSGALQAVMGSGDATANSLASLQNTLLTTPSGNYLWGTLERISTITFQIGLSVLAMYAFKFKKPKFLAYVFLAHAFLDFTSVYMLDITGSIFLTETFIFLCAVVMIYVILKIKKVYQRTLIENQ